MLAGWPSHVRIPVKVGQKEVDASRLPFACITIGTAGVRVPIEKVVLENIDTGKELTAKLGKTFDNDHPDYPFGGDEKRRALSMAILELPPGHYRLKSIEFTPYGPGVDWLTMPLPTGNTYCFTVKPSCVNYVGSVIFAANWEESYTGGKQNGAVVTKHFLTQITVERTAKRDQKWATKLIPCMAPLPWQESPFGELELSVNPDAKPSLTPPQ
jgi:hypothetical protein